MMRYQPPLPETIAQAAKLAAEGTNQNEIAKLLGTSKQTVARWKKDNPQAWHDARVARGRLKEADIDAAILDERIARATGLLAVGKKRDEAAEVLGVTTETLAPGNTIAPAAVGISTSTGPWSGLCPSLGRKRAATRSWTTPTRSYVAPKRASSGPR